MEFHANGEAVGVRFGRLLSKPVHLLPNAKEMLHVMADLMRKDISLGKVSGGAKTSREFIEEGEVQIHLLIGRAVKRADGRRSRSAGRVHRPGKENQPGIFVGATYLRKERSPGVFRIRQNNRRKLAKFVCRRAAWARFLRRSGPSLQPLDHCEDRKGIRACRITHGQDEENASDSQPACSGRPQAAAVIYIAAFPSVSQAHRGIARLLGVFLIDRLNEFIRFHDRAVHVFHELIDLRINFHEFALDRGNGPSIEVVL